MRAVLFILLIICGCIILDIITIVRQSTTLHSIFQSASSVTSRYNTNFENLEFAHESYVYQQNVSNDDNEDNNNKYNNHEETIRTDATNSTEKPIVIAYVISLIKCNDYQSTESGLQDSAIVLRHSVHLNSIRNKQSGSKYDYKMYAIVHKQATKCSEILKLAGYTLLIRDNPVNVSDISSAYLRRNIHTEECCGADEFVKLYAYTLTGHPIVVHTDIDLIVHQPMDSLYDAMLDPTNYRVRKQIRLEPTPNNKWPQNVEAFLTRDWVSTTPGRKSVVQAGIFIIKPNLHYFHTMIDTILNTYYVGSQSMYDNGWAGKGYGSGVGSMAMQGLLAYVYDEILPHNWVELNQCNYNHMGVIDRYPPDIGPYYKRCRNGNKWYCGENCMQTPLSKIYTIHYTGCTKPWKCFVHSNDVYHVNRDHCLALLNQWHTLRTDIENKLYQLTNDPTIAHGQMGEYYEDTFQGHCKEQDQEGYIQLTAKRETLQQLEKIYEP